MRPKVCLVAGRFGNEVTKTVVIIMRGFVVSQCARVEKRGSPVVREGSMTRQVLRARRGGAEAREGSCGEDDKTGSARRTGDGWFLLELLDDDATTCAKASYNAASVFNQVRAAQTSLRRARPRVPRGANDELSR